jgi:anti-sigma factor RsiW
MSELDFTAAGITCRQVLTVLSDYLEGELEASEVSQIEAHLRECDRCERFGGAFAGVVAALRKELSSPAALEPAVADRLQKRLEREIDGPPGG